MEETTGYEVMFGYTLEFEKYEEYLNDTLKNFKLKKDDICDVYNENITSESVCENKNLILRSFPNSCIADYLVIGIKLANVTSFDKSFLKPTKFSKKQLDLELKNLELKKLIDFTQVPQNYVVDIGCDCCT